MRSQQLTGGQNKRDKKKRKKMSHSESEFLGSKEDITDGVPTNNTSWEITRRIRSWLQECYEGMQYVSSVAFSKIIWIIVGMVIGICGTYFLTPNCTCQKPIDNTVTAPPTLPLPEPTSGQTEKELPSTTTTTPPPMTQQDKYNQQLKDYSDLPVCKPMKSKMPLRKLVDPTDDLLDNNDVSPKHLVINKCQPDCCKCPGLQQCFSVQQELKNYTLKVETVTGRQEFQTRQFYEDLVCQCRVTKTRKG